MNVDDYCGTAFFDPSNLARREAGDVEGRQIGR